MTKAEMMEGMRKSKAAYVTYGDDGIVVKREDAIADITEMEDPTEGGDFGTWDEIATIGER
jgi:hydrogenase maturation factor